MWFKKKDIDPVITMVCISSCQRCGAPIYGPAEMDFFRDVATDDLVKILAAKIVNFCICRNTEFGFEDILKGTKFPTQGN